MGNGCSRKEPERLKQSKGFGGRFSAFVQSCGGFFDIFEKSEEALSEINKSGKSEDKLARKLLRAFEECEGDEKTRFFALLFAARESQRNKVVTETLLSSAQSKVLISLNSRDLSKPAVRNFNSDEVYSFNVRRISLQLELIESLAREPNGKKVAAFKASLPRLFPVKTSYMDLLKLTSPRIRNEMKLMLSSVRAARQDLLAELMREVSFSGQCRTNSKFEVEFRQRYSPTLARFEESTIFKLDNDVADVMGLLAEKQELQNDLKFRTSLLRAFDHHKTLRRDPKTQLEAVRSLLKIHFPEKDVEVENCLDSQKRSQSTREGIFESVSKHEETFARPSVCPDPIDELDGDWGLENNSKNLDMGAKNEGLSCLSDSEFDTFKELSAEGKSCQNVIMRFDRSSKHSLTLRRNLQETDDKSPFHEENTKQRLSNRSKFSQNSFPAISQLHLVDSTTPQDSFLM